MRIAISFAARRPPARHAHRRSPIGPRDALAVLRANCYRCHGQDGSREGGFGNVLDVAALRERKLVVPGDADQSKLFRRVAKGQMPPRGRVAAAVGRRRRGVEGVDQRRGAGPVRR